MPTVYALLAVLGILAIAAVAMRARQSSKPASLYSRLGGVYPIAAVIDDFSNQLLKNPMLGVDSPNPQLREWSRNQSAARLPGLKEMRTLWVSDATGGPLKFRSTVGAKGLNLEEAHRHLKITPAEFDETARELAAAMERHGVPAPEAAAVLGAFAAHKTEVTAGSRS